MRKGARHRRSRRRLHSGFLCVQLRSRVPPRAWPALYFDSLYNLGSGAFFSLYALSVVVTTTILHGGEWHLAVLGAAFGGSSLLSPLVTYCGRQFAMRSLVVGPSLVMAAMLCGTAWAGGGADFFALVVGGAFLVRAFPRVAEMNMYQLIYPATHRSAAVGWTKSVFGLSSLAVTLVGYGWFLLWPNSYWVLFCLVGAVLAGGAWCYGRIPVTRKNVFAPAERLPPHRAFWRGVRTFLSDRAFVSYQLGFSLAGSANHLSIVFVAQVLREDVLKPRGVSAWIPAALEARLPAGWTADRQWWECFLLVLIVGLIVAVLPAILTILSSPFWGRALDRIDPMTGRGMFNAIQCLAYGLYGYGGLSRQVWPFLAGTVLHAIGTSGSTINWLTGSLYFARPERVPLYNSVHVGLTGLRGMIAPIVGGYLMSPRGMNLGAWLFILSCGLSLAGAAVMFLQGRAAAES